MTTESLQEIWLRNHGRAAPGFDYSHCFGCGPQNDHGLQIRSFWNGEECTCRWQPESHHNGIAGVLNGGIVATVLDCHCFWTALASVYQEQGRPFGTGEPIQMVTGAMTITYRQPIPMGVEIELRARLGKKGTRSRSVTCSVWAEGKACALGEVTLVLVGPKKG